MKHRLLLAAVATFGLFATQAYAGSPFYGTDRTDLAGPAEEYRAIAPETGTPALARPASRSATSAGPEVVLGADGHLPVQNDSLYFRRASGSMGAP